MDYDKLIERLKSAAGGPEGIKMCHDAALAIKPSAPTSPA